MAESFTQPLLRSMTGYARVRRPLGNGEVVVGIKSLNHRGLDLQIHAASGADPYENAIRALVKGRVNRGHIEVRLSLPENSSNEAIPALNHAFLEAYLKTFRDAAREHGITAHPDLNSAFGVPGMFNDATGIAAESPEGTEALLLDAVGEALDQLNAFRTREGAEIAAEMRTHNEHIAAAAAEMEKLRVNAAGAFQARLADRLKDLLKGVQLDPQRLAQEAAVLADRSDISEELARLRIHSGQLTALLNSGGEVGKKLDFLLQEMNRETNTILSKTNGAGDAGLRITELGLSVKAAIEKIREQSLNLE